VISRRRHQLVFVAAGAWNLAWGLWTALRPRSLYEASGLDVPERPEVAACLGMVVGLYGVVYLEIARRPERGWVPAAVGLAGKTLGPAALAVAVRRGGWPASAFRVVAANDLVWWLPFAAYLRDAWPDLRADVGRPRATCETLCNRPP
jgi:hypothetical protein